MDSGEETRWAEMGLRRADAFSAWHLDHPAIRGELMQRLATGERRHRN